MKYKIIHQGIFSMNKLRTFLLLTTVTLAPSVFSMDEKQENPTSQLTQPVFAPVFNQQSLIKAHEIIKDKGVDDTILSGNLITGGNCKINKRARFI